MYPSVQREIPEFIKEQVVYSDILRLRSSVKSCLVLTRNLHFFEFQNKQLLQTIDLSKTILSKVHQKLLHYKGPNGKWHELNQAGTKSTEVNFGKFIYQNFDVLKLYLLLRCWDKIIVLCRLSDTEAYNLIAEYEDVLHYKLVHGDVKYQAAVELHFNDGASKRTDFEENEHTTNEDYLKTASKCSDFKQLLDRVRTAKTELQLHKVITQNEFEHLRDTQHFGCNFLRNLQLEEKHMLARCGDVWARLTLQNKLVLGVSLVNNCVAPNLTQMKNLRPVLKFNEKNVTGITYQYRLFCLKQNFDDLESLETFFQTEDALESNSWCADRQHQQRLLPEMFAVLLVEFNILEIIALKSCPLFLFYDVERVINLDETKNPKTRLYEQNLFLKNINFSEILSLRRQTYEISFKESTLHQDFLAIAATSTEAKVLITFVSSNDLQTFKYLLAKKFELDVVKRKGGSSVNCDAMEEDDQTSYDIDTSLLKIFHNELFFNQKPTSLWFGVLALRAQTTKIEQSQTDELCTSWTFYTKCGALSFQLLRLLFDELLLLCCNISRIEFPLVKQEVQGVEFEHAFRQEIRALSNFINNRTTKKEIQTNFEKLTKLQLHTDLSAAKAILRE